MRLNPALDELSPFSYCGTGYSVQLDANESCVAVSDEIKKEIADVVLNEINFNKYPDDLTLKLRAAYGKAFGVDAENVVVGNGSDELINMIVGRILPFGGVVVGFEYDFGSYWSNAAIFGRKAVKLKRNSDMTFTADMIIEGAEKNNADLVIFSNPNNPSGSQLEREEVIRVIESLDCLVAVDEAYMDFSNQSVLDLAGKYDNLIVLRTLSKAMGAAGARLGFAVSNQELCYAMRSVRDAYNISSIDQAVGRILLSHPEHREKTLAEIKRLMGIMSARLNDISRRSKQSMRVYPSVTNFILIHLEDTSPVAEAMHRKGISLRVFNKNLLRISVEREEILSMVLDELEAILTN